MFTALLTALALTSLSSAASPSAPALTCRFQGEPRAWTSQALTAWDRLDVERLRVDAPVTPTITLFDERCAYRLTPNPRGDFRVGARRYRTEGARHDGRVALPDGNSVPAARLAFASPTSDGGMFFIMALPSLWRADTAERRDPRSLSMVVFMHEFAHTQQAEGLGERIDAMLAKGLPEDTNDDVIQDRFADLPGYSAAYAAERDLFYQAADAPDLATARAHLAAAARAMKARRARWFTGPDAVYAEADDVFLTMEGTGNWAAWAWLTDRRGGAMSPADATAFVRGAGSHWSQDEGLGVILAISRLIPDWSRLAFGPDGVTADMLIGWALQGDQ